MNGIKHNNIKISEMVITPGSSYLIASSEKSSDAVKIMILREQEKPVIVKSVEEVPRIKQSARQGTNMANIYLLLMSVIMVFMMFAPIYKLINVDIMKQSGWTYEISQLRESYNVLQMFSAMFMDEYTTSKGGLFIFIGGLFSIAFAVAITICSTNFLKDVFVKKKLSSGDFISYNMYFAIGLVISLYVFIFGLALTLDSWSNSLTTVQVSVTFLLWLILGLAILSEVVLCRLYIAETQKINN